MYSPLYADSDAVVCVVRYTEEAARQIMFRILNAVRYLHSRDIVSARRGPWT